MNWAGDRIPAYLLAIVDHEIKFLSHYKMAFVLPGRDRPLVLQHAVEFLWQPPLLKGW